MTPRKKPKARVRKKHLRQARALAAADRRAWLGLAVTLAGIGAFFAAVVTMPPRISPEQLADAVQAQAVHKRLADLPSQTRDDGPGQPRPSPSSTVASDNRPVRVVREQVEYVPIEFEQLAAFQFMVTDRMVHGGSDPIAISRSTLAQIPQEIKALDAKKVALKGFMLPMKYEGKLATEFLLLRSRGLCCYGVAPKITEWVEVRMRGKGVKAVLDEPVTVCGVFHVGDRRANGDLVGIYGLDGERLKGPGE